MANKFVWSGATGGADGSKWEDAYTSLMRDWGAEAGFTPGTDFIYVRSVHSESTAATLTITGSTAEGSVAACRVICCVGATTGTDPGALATGASVTTSGVYDIIIDESIYIYGVEFYSGNDIRIINSTMDHEIVLEKCRLEISGGSADVIQLGRLSTPGARVYLIDVDMDFSSSIQRISLIGGKFVWWGGSILYDLAGLITYQNLGSDIEFRGIDFSVMTSSYLVDLAAPNSYCRIIFSRCLLATGMTLTTGTCDQPGARMEFYHCQIGTDSDPAYQMEIHTIHGKIVTDTSRYRTGGAKDSERTNPISWDFDTTVGSVRGYPGHPLESPPITAWTDGDGSTQHTYRIAFASDATINDNEIWMELEGPNDAATDSLAALKSNRVAPLTTASARTTDSGSTWTGSGVGTKQYMQIQYTPDKPGPVTVRVFMAKASDHIYVDPKIQIDP